MTRNLPSNEKIRFSVLPDGADGKICRRLLGNGSCASCGLEGMLHVATLRVLLFMFDGTCVWIGVEIPVGCWKDILVEEFFLFVHLLWCCRWKQDEKVKKMWMKKSFLKFKVAVLTYFSGKFDNLGRNLWIKWENLNLNEKNWGFLINLWKLKGKMWKLFKIKWKFAFKMQKLSEKLIKYWRKISIFIRFVRIATTSWKFWRKIDEKLNKIEQKLKKFHN